ncbi:MAG: diaminopimelate decarboxylase [Elusimicrobia bacterium]|jgi:diaminopimelate decarboxylase|nr:diaminopimelate decarboxylase [Elusimicrobiota bacterium]MBK7207620.1 diaminopimelate decarboxylase [Elusimicrobiota bacterium]MBK7544390.1 diaminopimelate decarboxylase [Elusimicrobiota bacterium]MBK7573912.1 diaminopimelate decarboxylase [Elusimicrobiota bacterium]MBK7689510.1 diaminopimelate decarboxylase [Elusimicrobiota bacterium]
MSEVRVRNPYETFRYVGKDLFVEGRRLADLAARWGTPLYVYSAAKIRAQFRRFDRAFAAVPHTVCYALKANSNLGVVNVLAREGAGADIVSGGELARALKAGVPAARIVFSGVGKTEPEMVAALKAGILMFNIESAEELGALDRVAARLRRAAPVSVRVNPNVVVDTHHHITTGRAENKFGVSIGEAEKLYRWAAQRPWLRVVGLQAHIGSQLLDVRPYGETLDKLLALMARLEKAGIFLHVLDLGGGLGVAYKNDRSADPAALARELLPRLKNRNVRLLFEPGRFLVAEAGCLLTRVLYRKEPGHKNFVIVDAAMNDLARPALYDAHHPIWPTRKSRGGSYVADVVGPICESGDYLAKARAVPRPKAGDLWAVMAAGAYGFSMSSQYNTRPRAAEVLVDGAKAHLIRRRETLADLTRGESLPGGRP